MKNRTVSRILLSIGLSVCAYQALAQKAVLVVRHGEKISDTDERLTEAGRARAERLAKMLRDADVTAIYSTDTERTRGTVQPLAAALGLTIVIYDKDVELVGDIRQKHGSDVVLVAGHSNTVPGILKALGCKEEIKIASDEYDNLFVVVPRPTAPATMMRMKY